jgi:hypothetical protein
MTNRPPGRALKIREGSMRLSQHQMILVRRRAEFHERPIEHRLSAMVVPVESPATVDQFGDFT